eukprot:4313299-Amphidinium_carterae.2
MQVLVILPPKLHLYTAKNNTIRRQSRKARVAKGGMARFKSLLQANSLPVSAGQRATANLSNPLEANTRSLSSSVTPASVPGWPSLSSSALRS